MYKVVCGYHIFQHVFSTNFRYETMICPNNGLVSKQTRLSDMKREKSSVSKSEIRIYIMEVS